MNKNFCMVRAANNPKACNLCILLCRSEKALCTIEAIMEHEQALATAESTQLSASSTDAAALRHQRLISWSARVLHMAR